MGQRPEVGMAEHVEDAVRVAILGVCFEAVRRRNPGAVVNGVIGLGFTFLPAVLEHRYDVSFRPWQRVYAALAMLMHAVGMLGPYDEIWWWDHLTHVYSSTLLGGVAHVFARQRGLDPRSTVVYTVAVGGLLWEVVEYTIHAVARRFGFEPILISYGPVDTTLDLLFNAIGAILVLAFGDRLLNDGDGS